MKARISPLQAPWVERLLVHVRLPNNSFLRPDICNSGARGNLKKQNSPLSFPHLHGLDRTSANYGKGSQTRRKPQGSFWTWTLRILVTVLPFTFLLKLIWVSLSYSRWSLMPRVWAKSQSCHLNCKWFSDKPVIWSIKDNQTWPINPKIRRPHILECHEFA